MRAGLSFLVPLLLLLAVVAYGASQLMERQQREWASRDLEMRSQLVFRGARTNLAEWLEAGKSARLRVFLEELVRDERLLGAAICPPGGSSSIRTPAYPPELGCEQLDLRAPGDRNETELQLAAGAVHLSVLPITDDSQVTLGNLVLVHDMSYVERRTAETRKATLLGFGLVGILAAVATLLVARFSWISWTAELRRILASPFRLARSHTGSGDFQPFHADVRELVSRLATDEANGLGGRWSPNRLRKVLRTRLQGEAIIVVANREPYIHEQAADGAVRVIRPASGLVTALEPVLRACSGTWVAHGRARQIAPWWTDAVESQSRLAIRPTPCDASGSPRQRSRATTTATRMRASGPCAILPTPGRSSAPRTLRCTGG
jgi:trehalose 6-phosphate synthase